MNNRACPDNKNNNGNYNDNSRNRAGNALKDVKTASVPFSYTEAGGQEVQAMERAVVVAMLASPASIHEVAGVLRAEMFLDVSLRLVWTCAENLLEKGKMIDMLTLEEEMRATDTGAYERLNGLSFLSEMFVAVRSDVHIRMHALYVRNAWLMRRLSACLKENVLLSMLPGHEAAEMLLRVDRELALIQADLYTGLGERTAAEVAREVLDRSRREQELRLKGIRPQIQTGFRELDALTGGLYRKELTVVSARPSMGKSAVALYMALEAARQGKHAVYFSVEMSEEDMALRLLSMLSGVDPGKIRYKGTCRTEDEALEKARKELESLPIRLLYCGSLGVDEIRAYLSAAHKRGELDVFFIDYLNLMQSGAPGSRHETTDLALGEVVRKVKLMAMELDVPAVLLVQMNRESERRPAPYFPILSDLRNSGATEQVADSVIFVYRSEKYGITYDKKTNEDLRGVGHLMVAKNRNGSTGNARFRYNPSMTSFRDYDNRLL